MRATRSRIALVGFMGAGKSTLAPVLAAELGWRAVDTDVEVVTRSGLSIDAIFREESEARFRELEAEAVRRVLRLPRVVVALGGGAFSDPSSTELIRARCAVIHLRARASTLARRVENAPDPRPLLSRGFPHALLEARLPAYELADLSLDTDERSPQELAREIVVWWRAREGSRPS